MAVVRKLLLVFSLEFEILYEDTSF